mmetsp:Transcript_27357/g.66436  ORF Transcript_27357/g.66436 Transcript_27357/m.66436 type:complete len:86 (-) Transcript_27357:85-342(-)
MCPSSHLFQPFWMQRKLGVKRNSTVRGVVVKFLCNAKENACYIFVPRWESDTHVERFRNFAFSTDSSVRFPNESIGRSIETMRSF